MSEDGDYSPGVWASRNFVESKATYDAHVGRSYEKVRQVSTPAPKPKEIVPTQIKTKSKAPLIIACDVTGSMGEWPATIFSKLPYLENEGKEYLGDSMEISFLAIGDVFGDKYPLQARPFTSGLQLETELKQLEIEGKGGGTMQESYDLALLYCARNIDFPKLKNKPLLIVIGDEGLYDFVDRDGAKQWAHVDLAKRMTLDDLFDEVKQKFSVYLIRKPYHVQSLNKRSKDDEAIQDQWEAYLGADHVSVLPDASRVVDVIFGIMARETSRIDYFKKEIKGRQRADQVEVVMKSLQPLVGAGKGGSTNPDDLTF